MENDTVKHIEGFIENIIFRNEDNGYTVFDIIQNNKEITCVGVFSYISAGEFIAAEGEYVRHKTYDMQFQVKSYEFRAPADEDSVRRYLSSGAIRGVKEKLADRIVDTFGDDTFRIMEEEPERLAEIKGISLSKAMDIAEQLVSKRDMRKAMIFMQDYGIGMNLANKIYSKYGQNIYTILKDNPYKIADDIEGVGFKMADEIASKAGISVDSDFRINSGIIYCLKQSTLNGNVYMPSEQLKSMVSELLLIDIQDYQRHISDLAVDKKIVVRDTNKIYLSKYFYMESNIARHLADLNIKYDENEKYIDEQIRSIEEEKEIELDDIQKEAVKKAVMNGFLVVTGGPGTGKTTTINTIIEYFIHEQMTVRLAAPTGRAAKRMTETSGYEAQTIHRLLEICGGPDDDNSRILSSHFDRNEDNPLEEDVIIIDEVSMVDVNIMNLLLKAVPIGTRLILVGDVDQLPSVGPGNVLKDIINSRCFPVVRLEKIFRQAAESEIITNAHKINNGEKIVLNKYSKDFLFVKRDSADKIIGAMKTLLKDKLPEYVNADISDIQILTPTKKSVVGAQTLNKVMQEYLNPPNAGKMEKTFGDIIFREGDKIMQIKNDYQMEWERKNSYGVTYEHGNGIFNGDCGIITEINDFSEEITVRFEEDKFTKYEFGQLDELDLAYAITIHKSQGSEYPAVIIPMYMGPKMLMNRNLLYTAVTRARTCVCMVGIEECFHQMAANKYEQERYSSLDSRIKELYMIDGGDFNKQ